MNQSGDIAFRDVPFRNLEGGLQELLNEIAVLSH